MASLLPKSLKDMRRRSVEYALGAMGTTDRTTDPEWDAHNANYKKTIIDLNNCTYLAVNEYFLFANDDLPGRNTQKQTQRHLFIVNNLTFQPLFLPSHRKSL